MIDKAILDKIKAGARVRVVERVLMDLSEERKGAKVAVKSTKAEKVIKERVSTFEGLVIARKHGNEAGATFTVRATVAGVGMEKVYPINAPTINKVDILSSPKKVGRSKLYYLRDLSARNIRRKMEV
ncbi:MAG: hypothetical protein A3B23_00845 [Candidatus Colwellbacteria bacterium RIFCSPLOWO2_01_FULL_48_10]|uniref:50S ribosomal protein L19 n=2 Tax=Bacteria candidate phyla TaxID=1783234 RepID=A0A1F5P4Y3_9BACT|nr:MAG: hypothetical protein A2846_04125 [Candidatus Doudnabacteria bacterium RIFCSPHIGHO2_01_FULL_49_9]OGY59494.1 MAG: hypothetical protein A3B23_00845 [Candidatus Colwellbacteria bacterium RIFCSPLOWO2_01_FULL_48_10]